jgi:hypothetical protein
MKSVKIGCFMFLFASFFMAKADEGMWIPLLLQKYNESDMYKQGLKIPADDIYSINHTSLKDAIVLFGRGCSGELVSDQGLLLTNHHCGFPQIQALSSIDHDYLTNGFWATSFEQELPCPGLTVSFLIRMEDVTKAVLKDVTPRMNEIQRAKMIETASKILAEDAIRNTHYIATVKPLYYGNQYFLYVMEVFRDVRLVGAPPSAIGKFGGDTDNWEWPRHTGDFSVFRIYCNKDNEPAAYSKDNIPYKPKKHLVISLKGVNENDFTMVYGYPFSTQEYLTSYGVKMISDVENPARVSVRNEKLNIIGKSMKSNPVNRIKYASKQAGIANSWKKWKGEINGIKVSGAIDKKKEIESRFVKWTLSDDTLKYKYGSLLPEFEYDYLKLEKINLWMDYFTEAIWNDDLVGFASKFRQLANPDLKDTSEINKIIKGLKASSKIFFRDYDPATEKKIFLAMISLFSQRTDVSTQPDVLKNIVRKYKGDIDKYVVNVFEKSFLADEKKTVDFLNNYKPAERKTLMKDPVYELMQGFVDYYFENYVIPSRFYSIKIDSLSRLYMAGLMEMQKEKLFYPDANGTMRLSYGKIKSYYPHDAVKYQYFTTIDGIMEKENPEVDDYHVPDRLKELYKLKDYGRYGSNGTIHIAFIANNHTTGGNSGSPVLNAKGELVGINFDRDWEGTMSDIIFNPDQCRNISLDIRYCLFIIDKYAGAKRLVDEMEIVGE